MKLTQWVEKMFTSGDREQKDEEINRLRATARNNTQVVLSGTRIVETMTGMLQIVTENHHGK